MIGGFVKLNERLYEALSRGDIIECRELMAAGAGSPSALSSCEQASWLKAAIAAPEGRLEALDLLLSAGFDPNSVYDQIGEDYQNTPITAAVQVGRLDVLEKLVTAGADIHWRSPTGACAASEALPCLSSQAPRPDTPELAAVREWLTQRGAMFDPACRDSRRKLSWSASNPFSWPDIPRLIGLGMDPNTLDWTPFMMKLAAGDVTVEDVLSMPPQETAHRDRYDRTPFLMAVAAGRRDLSELLLTRGSDLNARAWCGASALHLAARYDQTHLVEWLASLGMQIEIEDEHHHTPLREAVSHDMIKSAKKLLELGANAIACDDNGYQIIHEAGSRELLDLLLSAGADVNAVSGGGDWPLKDACALGDASLVKYLLERGANPDQTSTGETALFSAVSADSLECVALLLGVGAEINATDCDGWTCLWLVRSLPMAKLLLQNAADPSIADQCDGLPEEWSLPLAVSALFKETRIANEMAK